MRRYLQRCPCGIWSGVTTFGRQRADERISSQAVLQPMHICSSAAPSIAACDINAEILQPRNRLHQRAPTHSTHAGLSGHLDDCKIAAPLRSVAYWRRMPNVPSEYSIREYWMTPFSLCHQMNWMHYRLEVVWMFYFIQLRLADKKRRHVCNIKIWSLVRRRRTHIRIKVLMHRPLHDVR